MRAPASASFINIARLHGALVPKKELIRPQHGERLDRFERVIGCKLHALLFFPAILIPRLRVA